MKGNLPSFLTVSILQRKSYTHLDTLGTGNFWEGCEQVWSKVNLVRSSGQWTRIFMHQLLIQQDMDFSATLINIQHDNMIRSKLIICFPFTKKMALAHHVEFLHDGIKDTVFNMNCLTFLETFFEMSEHSDVTNLRNLKKIILPKKLSLLC